MQQDNEAKMHSEQGLALANNGNLPSAETELRKAAALAPANADYLDDLATILAMEKKFDESTSYFRQALKIHPQDMLARRYLAANLWQTHRYAEARQELQTLLKANPNDGQALLLLGMVAENTGDYSTAARVLASAPSLVRTQPESIAALARSYYHIGETKRAQAWLNELQNHAAGIRAVLLGAQIADEMKDYKTAEVLLSSAMPRYPDQTELRYRLALVKFHARQFEESGQILQQLLNGGHKTSEIDHLLASCFQAEKRYEEAIHALQEAIQLDPGNEASYLDLASILLTQKQISPATELAQRMGKTFPDSFATFLSKGKIELGASDYTDAVSSFARAAQLDPASSEAVIGLARAQANAGMTGRAKSTLDGAIARFSQKAPFELELGQLLLREAEAGNKAAELKAEHLFNSAVAHDSKLAEAYYELGALALGRGDAAKAATLLEKAETLDPLRAKTHFALSRAYRRLGREQEAAKQATLFDRLKE
jgi:tetratricopeptide (TPR) repeat protein